MMKYLMICLVLLSVWACKEEPKEKLNAQQIVDRAIEQAGGPLYGCSYIDFVFRDRQYSLLNQEGNRILKRFTKTDSTTTVDIKDYNGFVRLVDGEQVQVPDTLVSRYANAVNSVHYFAYLPYGLNDVAVRKKRLDDAVIGEREYYKVEITFREEGGGDDYDDVFVYWIDKETFKPDYLAYEFHVNGGGLRFREAFNERFVSGIRFVDSKNYKPKELVSVHNLDRLYKENQLELLSTIELQDVAVNVDNCN